MRSSSNSWARAFPGDSAGGGRSGRGHEVGTKESEVGGWTYSQIIPRLIGAGRVREPSSLHDGKEKRARSRGMPTDGSPLSGPVFAALLLAVLIQGAAQAVVVPPLALPGPYAATFSFQVSDGMKSTMQTKSIVRQVFRPPGTVCR